jgi:hypothetical protein
MLAPAARAAGAITDYSGPRDHGAVIAKGVGIDHQRFVREAAHLRERRDVALAEADVEHPARPSSPVSSQVSQLPHGVTPPAQLRMVPARLDHESSHSPRRVSKSRFVVPSLPGMPPL